MIRKPYSFEDMQPSETYNSAGRESQCDLRVIVCEPLPKWTRCVPCECCLSAVQSALLSVLFYFCLLFLFCVCALHA